MITRNEMIVHVGNHNEDVPPEHVSPRTLPQPGAFSLMRSN